MHASYIHLHFNDQTSFLKVSFKIVLFELSYFKRGKNIKCEIQYIVIQISSLFKLFQI